MHRAATNLPLLITVNKGGSRRDGGTLIVVLLWCCFSELDRYLTRSELKNYEKNSRQDLME